MDGRNSKHYTLIFWGHSIDGVISFLAQQSSLAIRQAAWQMAGRWLLPLEADASGYIQSPTLENRSVFECGCSHVSQALLSSIRPNNHRNHIPLLGYEIKLKKNIYTRIAEFMIVSIKSI